MTTGDADRGTVSTGEVEESWPSGRQLRKLTRAATEAHTGGHMGELVSEVYQHPVTVLTAPETRRRSARSRPV